MTGRPDNAIVEPQSLKIEKSASKGKLSSRIYSTWPHVELVLPEPPSAPGAEPEEHVEAGPSTVVGPDVNPFGESVSTGPVNPHLRAQETMESAPPIPPTNDTDTQPTVQSSPSPRRPPPTAGGDEQKTTTAAEESQEPYGDNATLQGSAGQEVIGETVGTNDERATPIDAAENKEPREDATDSEGSTEPEIVGATKQELRVLLGKLTHYVDTDDVFVERRREIELLAKSVEKRLERVYEDIGEVQGMRLGIERYFFMKMKQDERLYDGSHKWELSSESEEEPKVEVQNKGKEREAPLAEAQSVMENEHAEEADDGDWGMKLQYPSDEHIAEERALREAALAAQTSRQGENILGHEGTTGGSFGGGLGVGIPRTPTRTSKRDREDDDSEVDVRPQKLARLWT